MRVSQGIIMRLCMTCDKKFFRNCPKCGKKLGYTIKKNMQMADRKKRMCISCKQKEVSLRPESRTRYEEKGRILSEAYSGPGNPFYGHIHNDETLSRFSVLQKNRDQSVYRTKSFRSKISQKTIGNRNPMYGRNIYQIWVEKYGEEEAIKRMSELSSVRSNNVSGFKNPMYGKPSPVGSGNGWAGWYKGWFFRSLRELSYVIDVVERNNHKWVSAEQIFLCIPYTDFDGTHRNYIPDFVLDGRIIIEVKPKQLMDTPSNILKQKAAYAFCKKNGFEYRIIDVKIIDQQRMFNLCLSGDLVFTKKYQSRFSLIMKKSKKV